MSAVASGLGKKAPLNKLGQLPVASWRTLSGTSTTVRCGSASGSAAIWYFRVELGGLALCSSTDIDIVNDLDGYCQLLRGSYVYW